MEFVETSRERIEAQEVFKFDTLRAAFLSVHGAIILYVLLGWLLPTRGELFVYTLVLPLMTLQWVLNGGSSIVNNFENIARVGQWSDPRNSYEGAFFLSLLKRAGIPASQAQITTVLCSLMLLFWLTALCRMILIVVPPQS
jgi:hypothetical protein